MNHEYTKEERRKHLIEQCRYFKGEKENPYAGTSRELMWDYESVWVEKLTESAQEAEIFDKRLASEHLDHLPEKYGVPSSLVGLLLGRYMYWSDPYNPSAGFEEWLNEHYL
jgi:hypothetical protein